MSQSLAKRRTKYILHNRDIHGERCRWRRVWSGKKIMGDEVKVLKMLP